MPRGYIIMQAAEGLPGYYSPKAGRKVGNPHGWTQVKDEALHFLRATDAQDFMEVFLPHAAAFCEVQPHEISHE